MWISCKNYECCFQKGITNVQLKKDLKIASSTMGKFNKGEVVFLSILLRICGYLNCDIGDIYEAVHEDKKSSYIPVQLIL